MSDTNTILTPDVQINYFMKLLLLSTYLGRVYVSET